MSLLFLNAVVVRRGTLAALALALLLIANGCNRARSTERSISAATVAPAVANPRVSSEETAVPLLPTPTPVPTKTPVPTPTPPAGTITLWHSWAQRDGNALLAILESFSAEYPSVQVDTLFVAQNDLLQSYAQAVTDGSGPDIVLAPNWWLHDLYSLGVVQPLDSTMYSAAAEDVWPAALDNLRINDQLYGIPTSYETVALYFNRELVAEESLPASLEELAQLAGQSPQFGIGIYANPFHVAWGFSAFGAPLFNDSGRAIFDESGGTAQFLQWLAGIDGLEGSYVDPDYGMILDRFKRGEYAFFVDGPWSMAELSQALGDRLAVATLPPGPGGQSRPWLYANAAYVRPNLSSQQSELVSLFLEHLVNEESGAAMANLSGRLPANRTTDVGSDPLLLGFAAQAANADGMRHGPEMDAFWRYGGDMILKALAGPQDMQSIVNETAALTNDASLD